MTSLVKMLQLFVMSMIPFLENKAALVYAAASQIKWYSAYAITTIGSYCPVPFLLNKAPRFHWRSKRVNNKLSKNHSKYRRLFDKYGPWGLFFLTAIPFTGIGCWLGALLADTAKLPKKPAAIALLCGTFVSGLLTTLTVYGLVKGTIFLLS